MKKIIPFLLALFLIVSCGNDDEAISTDDDVTDDNLSDCGFCEREFNGIYEITFSDDTNGPYSFSNKAMELYVNNPDPSTSLYNTSFEFSFQHPTDGQLNYLPSITGVLSNGNTLTYTNRSTNFSYIITDPEFISITGTSIANGTITFSDNNTTVSGTLNLSGGVTGTITFSATL